MPLAKLKPLATKRQRKPGKYSDGGGLYLVVTKAGNRKWSFRYMLNGPERWAGGSRFATSERHALAPPSQRHLRISRAKLHRASTLGNRSHEAFRLCLPSATMDAARRLLPASLRHSSSHKLCPKRGDDITVMMIDRRTCPRTVAHPSPPVHRVTSPLSRKLAARGAPRPSAYCCLPP